MASVPPLSIALDRRSVLSGLAGVGAVALTGLPPWRVVRAEEGGTLFDRLIADAARLAQSAYAPPAQDLPESLRGLSYDAYRDIRFRPDRALWRGQAPFEVQVLHLGGFLRQPVRVFTVDSGRPTPVLYSPDLYDFGRTGLEADGFGELGFSGLRVHYPLNDPGIMDELIVFQGASYFRALGAGCTYGLSARGVAVNTAGSEGEEFPAFRRLYVERPQPAAESLVLYGLLDGPSLAGAYRFTVTPGNSTRVTVQARLFARRPVRQLGVGVLTSMFAFGPVDRDGVDDFRPRVHDSQGLSMHTAAGEWLWRPLSNPRKLEMNIFGDSNPRGFGLLQRVRRFEAYQDLEALYHRRPSVWVTPHGDWGAGELFLVEIPTRDETNDNIVAFWHPARPFEPGQPLALDYDMDWGLDGPPMALAACRETMAGQYGVPGVALDDATRARGRKWVIDFQGGPLQGLRDPSQVAVVASVDGGRLDPPVHMLNPHTDGIRVVLDAVADDDAPINLRCHLRRDGAPASETWTMQWRPATDA
ncbi:glucan biosynthesis protein [Roseospira goensis]|uniref:Glucans biosynthesis protein G n=1 Tax=Roseospira goensis TaxID=391922 RepID=A0A7W6RYM3_9PROT|nr:glucan biosynthesis protein G [Roseospira goensis]MBB4284979.1 glucans biosynthesis protein [Roseospira goensis]